jgi:uncharacterized membrane protein YcjF (UPF0283 family)
VDMDSWLQNLSWQSPYIGQGSSMIGILAVTIIVTIILAVLIRLVSSTHKEDEKEER